MSFGNNFYIQRRNELLNKKRPYETDKSHVLSGKTHTFHMNMFLILLIYHLINVFFILKEPTLENIILIVTCFLHFKHKNIV